MIVGEEEGTRQHLAKAVQETGFANMSRDCSLAQNGHTFCTDLTVRRIFLLDFTLRFHHSFFIIFACHCSALCQV